MKRLSVLLLAGTILLLTGCASGPRWVITPVVDQQYCKVSLEHRMDNETVIKQGYNHPYRMDPLEMKRLLKGLSYRERVGLLAKPKKMPVFQDKEVARLVPALVDALATAGPDQRIRFVSINKGGGLFFAARRETEGVMFVRPKGALNMAFNLINYEFDSSRVSEVPPELAEREPLEVERSKTPLIPDLPYAKPHKPATGNPSPMWIVVSLDKLHEASKASPHPKPAAGVISPAEKPVEKQQQPESWEDQKKGVEQKLKFLKGLFEKGLINQQEYETRKNKVLDELSR